MALYNMLMHAFDGKVAIREAIQTSLTSLEFSPFDLVLGHTLVCPIKKAWLKLR